MTSRDLANRLSEKEDLIDHVREITGAEPAGIRTAINLLSHPDVVEHAIRYFRRRDGNTKCQYYTDPWSCAREAEAKYENIKFGWTGGAGVGFDDSWCDPCRQRVLDND